MTPQVFSRYPDAAAYAGADRAELETMIQSTGFFRNKSDTLIKLGGALVEHFDGRVPGRLADLVTLAGSRTQDRECGAGQRFRRPGYHRRHPLRASRPSVPEWTTETDPVKVELEIGAMFPRRDWTMLGRS